MKISFVYFSALMFLMLSSCKKDNQSNTSTRMVRYELFTNRDYSGETNIISFRVQIINAQKTLFDSILAPMKMEEIPDSAQKIIIEKAVPGNDPLTLKVGFYYSIQNVGISWHYESFLSQDRFKLVRFDFK
jgi:hypothetical protein